MKKQTDFLLDVTDGNKIRPGAGSILLSLMHYPDDLEQALDFFDAILAHAAIETLSAEVKQDTSAIFDRLKRTIDHLQQWIEKQAKARVHKVKDRTWRGAIAGDTLLYSIRLYFHAPPTSLNKAIAVVEESLRNATTQDGRVSGPKREREIKRIWGQYKAVAHLWGAFRLAQFHQGNETPWSLEDSFFFLKSDDRLLNFLSLADLLRRVGIAIKYKGQKQPILDPTGTWRLPSDFPLTPLSLTIPSFEDWEADVIKHYHVGQKYQPPFFFES